MSDEYTLEDRVLQGQRAAVLGKLGIPTVVCLCGSTRFSEAFAEANKNETLAGRIVLSVGVFGAEPSEKEALDFLHKRKIDLADEVLVLNVGGYVGVSTQSEINYAVSHHKELRYLEPVLA